MNKSTFLKSLGPGLLWAGAAIGVSHLVQSTRAGAHFGFSLVWVVIIANLLKYPFFEYGPRYAAATGESLIEGYNRLGKWAVAVFIIFTFGTMFTIESAETIVTASVASQLFGGSFSLSEWSIILLAVCVLILLIGRYSLLDRMIKIVIVILAITTIIALISAYNGNMNIAREAGDTFIWNVAGISFIVALMGWMPSPIDLSVWTSLWTLERKKQTGYSPKLEESRLDFNIGYIGTAVLALAFLALGSLVMYGTGETFSDSGITFAGQLIDLYTKSLGQWSRPIILIAAFTTMFSTTLTCTDAFPRVWSRLFETLSPMQSDKISKIYWIVMIVLVLGTIIILSYFTGGMTVMIDIATTLSFLTAPVLAYMNYRVIRGKNVPLEAKPPQWLLILNWMGLIFLSGFALLFIIIRFII